LEQEQDLVRLLRVSAPEAAVRRFEASAGLPEGFRRIQMDGGFRAS
jgi:hypothetical protein